MYVLLMMTGVIGLGGGTIQATLLFLWCSWTISILVLSLGICILLYRCCRDISSVANLSGFIVLSLLTRSGRVVRLGKCVGLGLIRSNAWAALSLHIGGLAAKKKRVSTCGGSGAVVRLVFG